MARRGATEAMATIVDEATAPQQPAIVPSAREQLVLGGLALVFLLVGAFRLTFDYGILQGDALSRTFAAATVLYNSPPGLANVGFVWSPLPSLLQVPLVAFRPLLDAGFAGPVLSALAAAWGLVTLNAILGRLGLGRPARYLMLAIYQTNVMVLYFSINGMTESLLIAIVLAAWERFQRLHDDLPYSVGASHVALMGVLAGLTFLTRYEGLAFGGALYLALLIVLVARGRAMSLFRWSLRHRRLIPPEGRVVIEGYSLAYLAPYTYAIFMWIFVNWLIMGDPLYFLLGRESNVAQSARLIASSTAFAAMKGSVLASSVYVVRAVALVFPAFYVVVALLFYLALRVGDSYALSLSLVALSFPAFQALMLYTAQSFGWSRFFIYAVPFSVIGLAYVARQLVVGYRVPRALSYTVAVGLLAASSLGTFLGLSAPGVQHEDELLFAQAVLTNQAVDNMGHEREIARYLAALPPGETVLVDDTQAFSILLFSQQLERFVATRNREFADAVLDPRKVGVDYVLVPRVGPESDRVVEKWPQVYDAGAPHLRLEAELPARSWAWRLYRVVAATNRDR